MSFLNYCCYLLLPKQDFKINLVLRNCNQAMDVLAKYVLYCTNYICMGEKF